MTDRARETAWTAKVGPWLLAAAVAGAALAVGAVHTVTLCVVTVVLAAAAVLVWWDSEPTRARMSATLLLVTGGVLTAYTACQCIPMPIGWLATIAPHNADVWSRALTPLREPGPSWAPISVDPTATRVELLKGVAYLLAFVTALRVARRREGVAFLSGVIVATGIALALAALLHPAFGAHKLYGIYEPASSNERHLAPLLNPNNLATYLNVALCLALAALLAPDPRMPRPILAAIVVVLAGTQVWVASRGGVATMVLGVAVVGVITRVARLRDRRTTVGVSLFAGVAAAAGAVMVALGSSEQAAVELFDTDASKFQLAVQAMHMLRAYPIFGTGRGAFESAFPAFRHFAGYNTLTHPENVIAQWLVEWGIPLGAAGLAAIALALRPNAVLARSTTAAGAWAAIVAVAVQNLVDLGSEIPGLMLAPVVCAAIVVGGTAGRKPRWRGERWGTAPRPVAMAGAAAAGCALAGAATGLGRELNEDQRTIHDAALGHVSVEQLHALERAAMMRHPAEPYLPFAAALRAARARDDRLMPWIEATLERARVYGPAHLVLARGIADQSPSQARLEYRLAMEQAPLLLGTVMDEAPRWVGGYYDAIELVPDDRAATTVLDLLVTALQLRLPATSVRLDAELAVRAPRHPGPPLRAAKDAVDDIEGGSSAPWCEGSARTACERRALDSAEQAEQLAPGRCEPHAVHARARLVSGDVAKGLEELSNASNAVGERVLCLKELVRLAGGAHDERRTAEALDKIAKAGCNDDAECAGNLAWVANVEEGRGNQRRALAMYKRAYARAPEQDWLLEAMARLAAAVGLHAEAAEDYERLARRRPGQAAWTKAADEQRAAALAAHVTL
jgi:tetratricopeptide (TPR) repeat protein